MPLDANDLEQIKKLISETGPKTKDGKFSLDDLVVAVQHLSKQTKSRFDEYDKKITTVTPPRPSDKKEDDKSDDVDLEKMSRADFANHLRKTFTGDLKSVLEPVLRGFDGVRTEAGRTRLELDVSEAEEKYPDLWDFEDEIKAELKQRPDLSVDEAYHLARAHNPDKTKEVVEKQEKESKLAKEKEEADKAADFLGFTPTSGKYAVDKVMDPDKAASTAWDATVKGTPAEKLLSVN